MLKRFDWFILVAMVAAGFPGRRAAAHPMGNFSINRNVAIRVEPDGLHVRYRIDFAEIPTFHEMQALDVNGDKVVSGDEGRRYLAANAPSWVASLATTVNGRPVPLTLVASDLVTRPGAGDLPTLLVTLDCLASLGAEPRGEQIVEFQDRNFSGRAGWREVTVSVGAPQNGRPACRLLNSTAPAADRSAGLNAYPTDALLAPPQEDGARFAYIVEPPPAIPTSGRAAPAQSPSAAPRPPAAAPPASRPTDRMGELIAVPNLSAGVLAASFVIAFVVGTFHGLSPGHGKTVVAAYLVGSRGTPIHACLLGAVVTLTHTAGVFLLGLIVLFASGFVAPEQLYPWLGFASGMTIVAVGMWQLVRRWSAPASDGAPFGGHSHEPGSGHSHLMPDRITPGGLIALGISGGMVPCPSALVVLLSAVAFHRIGYGLLLIVSFSLGLATVLIAVGLLMLYARRLTDGFDLPGGVLRRLPILSSAAVSIIGLVIALESLWRGGLLSFKLLVGPGNS